MFEMMIAILQGHSAKVVKAVEKEMKSRVTKVTVYKGK